MSAGVGAYSLSAATLEDAARAARFVLFLSGCADSTTYLKNEKTGEVVKCGGFHAVTFAESAIQQREVGAIWMECCQSMGRACSEIRASSVLSFAIWSSGSSALDIFSRSCAPLSACLQPRTEFL